MYIPLEQRVTAITLSLLLLLVIIQLIRKHKLREEYALIWLAASLVIVVFSIFGGLVNLLAAFFAVTYAPTLILVLGLLFALVVLLSQSVILSSQAKCIRDLAQNLTLLEWRLGQYEQQRFETTSDPSNGRNSSQQGAVQHD